MYSFIIMFMYFRVYFVKNMINFASTLKRYKFKINILSIEISIPHEALPSSVLQNFEFIVLILHYR